MPLELPSRASTRIVFCPPGPGSSLSARTNVFVGGVPLPAATACFSEPSTKKVKKAVEANSLAVAVKVIVSDSVTPSSL